MTDPDWQPYLDADEKILWQGRPHARIQITASHILRLLRGVIMLGLFLYILTRLNMGVSTYFDIQVIVFVLFFMAVPIDIIKTAFIRRQTRYALTTRRAIIATDLPFTKPRVSFYPILPGMAFDVSHGKTWSSIHFATPKRALWDPRGQAARIGFDRITDGPRTFALMGQIQRGET